MPTLDDNTSNTLKAYGGMFRWGSGLLGKTAVVIGILILCVFACIWKLHSDWAIVGVLALGAVIYFTWYFPLLKFANEHPAEAMLDGIQWSTHQQVMMASKGQAPTIPDSSKSPGAELVVQKAKQDEGIPL